MLNGLTPDLCCFDIGLISFPKAVDLAVTLEGGQKRSHVLTEGRQEYLEQ